MGEVSLTAGEARAYQALCAFCSWALLNDVGEEDAARLARDRGLFLEPPFSQVAAEDSRNLAAWLSGADGQGGAHALAREAHLDRSYLFYMVGQSRTSPYESVYRTDDATLFGPTTFEVRDLYAAHGLAYERNSREPDDHLGLELAFLAHLLGEAADGAEAGEPEGAAAVPAAGDADGAARAGAPAPGRAVAAPLAQAGAFLSAHVLVFAPVYLANVRTRARSAYYRAVAGIAASAIGALACALGAQPEETADEARFLLAE